MKTISQRTMVRMMEAFGAIPTAHSLLARELYADEFPEWFVKHAETFYQFNWDSILRDLRGGQFFYPGHFSDYTQNITGEYLTSQKQEAYGEGLLQALAAFIASRREGEAVLRSLELDGFGVNRERKVLVPLEGSVSEQEEEDRVTALVRASGLPNGPTILKHVNDAHSLFLDSKDHPALGESRSFLQALIDDISTETDKAGKHSVKLPGGTGPRVEYLRGVGFLTPDEEAAYKAAWGALSAGTHPGVPAREEARIGLILALEFGQLLLLKFGNWRGNQLARFSG